MRLAVGAWRPGYAHSKGGEGGYALSPMRIASEGARSMRMAGASRGWLRRGQDQGGSGRRPLRPLLSCC